jgi:hypothetical protein
VLLGGHNRLGDTVEAYSFSEPQTSYQISNETWEWDGTSWAKGTNFSFPGLSPAGRPSGPQGPALQRRREVFAP